MERITADGPNAQQIEFWNDEFGDKWVAMTDDIDAQIAPLSEVGLARAAASEGERVLDVGCGCGQTTLRLATKVGSGGRVLGVDLSASMLEHARERATAGGFSNVEFSNADAQTRVFEPDFDLLFSRFGVMFFAHPEQAFENLLSALRPGGRLACITWQTQSANPWITVPMQAVAKHLPPSDPPPPDAPGPFALADAKRVEGILTAAGFADVHHESVVRKLLVGGGGSLDESARFLLDRGPVGAALQGANDDVRKAAAREIRAALEPYQEDGGVRMSAAAWIVTARRTT